VRPRDAGVTPQAGEAAAFLSAVAGASPTGVRNALGNLTTTTPEHFTLVASHASGFDSKLVDQLVQYSACTAAMVENPGLTGRHLQRLLLWAIRSSQRDSSTAPGAPYHVLGVLAITGRLARFPFALRTLISRYRRIDSFLMAMNQHRIIGPRTVLACPSLAPEILLFFNEFILMSGGRKQPLRTDVATHPSANVAVWRALLTSYPNRELVRAISEIPAALEDWKICGLLARC
jgi:hypothetical protein